MTVETNYNPTRQLGNGVTTSFSFAFEVASPSDIVVYQRISDTQSVVPDTDYSVTVLSNGGNVVFNTAPAVGTTIVIDRRTPQTQETSYKTSSGFPAIRVEENFDKLTMMVQELQDESDRSLKVDETSGVDPDSLILQVERVYASIDNIDTVADDISNVNTVAGSVSNVNTVAGNISDVNTVAGCSSDVTTVAGVASDVTGVAGISTEVQGVYAIRGAVENVYGIESQVVDVSDNRTDISTVATNIANVNTVAGISSDVSAVAAIDDEITTVEGMASNISAVAGNATNINAVAGNSTNINTVAGDSSAINAVAADLSNIDTAASNIAAITAAPTYAAEAKQWAIGDPSEPVGNSAKYWAEEAAAVIPSQTGQSGKFLTTDGTSTSWATPSGMSLGDIYPVGAIYITTAATCPLASLISGSTWVLDASGIVTSINTSVPIKGDGKTLGFTDGTNSGGMFVGGTGFIKVGPNNEGKSVGTTRVDGNLANNKTIGITTDETKSGIVGTLTKTTLTVNIFRRTA